MHVPIDAMRSPVIDYHAMRMLRFRRALLAFFKRWGVYLAVAGGLFGAGSDAPLTVVAAAASLLLWPLRAAADRDWLVVPATIGYAFAGVLPVVLTRPLWWPRRWVDAERALPLPPRDVRRSDRLFGALVMLPWQALLLVAWLGIATHPTSQGAFHRALGFGGWVVAGAGSLWLSARWMRFARRPAPHAVDRVVTAVRPGASRIVGAARAIVVLPLARGRAPASAWALATGSLATVVCATLPWWTPLSIGWSLAALALVALTATSVLRARTMRELQPLWQTAQHLPIDVRAGERLRRLLALVPAMAGIVTCSSIVLVPSARPLALILYAGVLAAACGVESRDPGTMDATDHAARWFLMLATAVAFGSEVVAA